jgi:hypothetical protein
MNEFAVCGKSLESGFMHHWIIGTDKPANSSKVGELLDQYLKDLNDDYAIERTSALKEIKVETIPIDLFANWMKVLGKEGGQNKFPRVMKVQAFQEWLTFVQQELNNK